MRGYNAFHAPLYHLKGLALCERLRLMLEHARWHGYSRMRGLRFAKSEFCYQIDHSGITPKAVPRPMHYLCHAACQLEVRGVPL
jgi:hypothetical protein